MFAGLQWCAPPTCRASLTSLKKDMAEVSMECRGRAKQLVVFFGAASIGTGGGCGADAVLCACCKVVCRPRGTDQRQGRVVLVDEQRTTRVSSAMNGKQPCGEELDHEQPTRRADWKPPAGQVDLRLLRPAWSQQRDQPVRGLMWCLVVAPRKPPQAPRSSQVAAPTAASEPAPNMQRIGESRWHPLELCYWPDQGALPAKGKEYPELGYKRFQDKPPKAQQQQAGSGNSVGGRRPCHEHGNIIPHSPMTLVPSGSGGP
ncbi:hypothetical protein HaLaN_19245 [Haematococcus lacustris]|uniref:Uncharacterized protein n=1 Tax=Haematococcus lacustris TaxID=44745 RepID=A0A699ZU98_HAELA|nr:hypothetical protein HaLaN_19245 [Haematococcus lacustris]